MHTLDFWIEDKTPFLCKLFRWDWNLDTLYTPPPFFLPSCWGPSGVLINNKWWHHSMLCNPWTTLIGSEEIICCPFYAFRCQNSYFSCNHTHINLNKYFCMYFVVKGYLWLDLHVQDIQGDTLASWSVSTSLVVICCLGLLIVGSPPLYLLLGGSRSSSIHVGFCGCFCETYPPF